MPDYKSVVALGRYEADGGGEALSRRTGRSREVSLCRIESPYPSRAPLGGDEQPEWLRRWQLLHERVGQSRWPR
jgi:hypothetical protein